MDRPNRHPPAAIVTLLTFHAPTYDGGMQTLFLDESGNHSLDAYEPTYPVFVLGGVLVSDDGLDGIEAAVRAFKIESFGHDALMLHSADIARNRRGFEALADPSARRRFVDGLTALAASLDFTVIACGNPQGAAHERYGELAVDPYALSLGVVVERFCFALGAREKGRLVVESRNPRLDRELRTAWDLLRINGTRYVHPSTVTGSASSRWRSAAKGRRSPGSSSRTWWCRRSVAWSPACLAARTRTSSSAS